MIRRTVLAIAFANGLVGMAAAAPDVDARAQGALRKISAADSASRRHGHYRQARDLLVAPQRGLAARMTAWQRQTHAWADTWLAVLALGDLREQMPYEEFESTLRERLRIQVETLQSLREQSHVLLEELKSAASRIDAGINTPDAPELAPHAQLLTLLGQHERRLQETFADLHRRLTARIAELERFDVVSRQGVIARIRASLVREAIYPLEQTVARVDALLEAQAAIDPLIAQLSEAEKRANQHALTLRAFHLEADIEPARQLCAQARASIAAHRGVEIVAQAAGQRTEQLCTAIETHYRTVSSGRITRSDFVRELVRAERPQLDGLCRNSARPPAACERLAVIAALGPSALAGMDDAQLKFVEFEWTRLLDEARSTR